MVEWKHHIMLGCAVFTLFFAGCAEEGAGNEETDAATPDDAAGNTTVEEATSESAPTNNTTAALVPSFSISWDGNTSVAENGTHTVPADTNITFDASGTQNATTFTWTLGNDTFDGAVVELAFPAGNHTLTLEVAADNNTASVAIPIGAISTAAPVLEPAGSTPISLEAKGNVIDSCVEDTADVTFPAGTVTQHVKMTMDLGFYGSYDVTYTMGLRDADGNDLVSVSRANGNSDMTLDEATDIPAGDHVAFVSVCGLFEPQVTLTVTGQADHFA